LSYLVVDTNVIIRKTGKHKTFFDCFERTRDIIVASTDIIKEYEVVARTQLLLVRALLDDLRDKRKLKVIREGRINSNFKTNTRRRKPSMPSDVSDNKFVVTAVACESTNIISCDTHLKDLNPIRWNGKKCEVIEPIEYTRKHCPDLV
jgi:predicted nucleic acid-binding protein